MSTATTTTAGRTTAAETGLAATTVQRRPSRASYTDDSEAHLFRSRLGSLSQQDYTQPIDEEEEQLKHHFDDSKATSDAENSRPPSPPVLATYPPSQAKPAELAAVDQGAAAWRFLACGFVIWSMVWGVAYSYGSFQDYHEHNSDSPLYGTSVTGISAVGTLVIGCQHFIPLILRGFVTTFPHLRRRLVLVSVVLSSACILVASFARSIAMLIVFQGVLFGVTSGVLLLPVVLYLGQWFDTRRGLATGVIFMGSGFGGVVFPLILNALLTSIGFAWTMRVWALAQLVLTGTALWFVNPRLPLETPDVLPITKLELAKALLPGDLSWLTHPLSLIYVSATRPQKVGDTRLIFFWVLDSWEWWHCRRLDGTLYRCTLRRTPPRLDSARPSPQASWPHSTHRPSSAIPSRGLRSTSFPSRSAWRFHRACVHSPPYFCWALRRPYRSCSSLPLYLELQ